MQHSLLHLLHPLRILWNERITLFWQLWGAITILAVLLLILLLPRGNKTPRKPSFDARWSPGRILATAILVVILASYFAGSLVWEDFTYYDHSHFTNGTLVGYNIPVQIAPQVGRFWPLGHQEFNLLGHFTHSVFGYHALRIVQQLLVFGLLLVLLQELSFFLRVILILLLLITPSVVISFTGLIYSEANIILLMIFLAWCVKRFDDTQFIGWAVAAVISAQLLLYYKETAFLLLCGFAIGRLLLRCRNKENEGWSLDRLRDIPSRLDLYLLGLVVPFLLYYLAAMFPKFQTNYVETFHLPFVQVLAGYLALDLLVWVFAAVSVTRIVLILRGKTLASVFWDGLALAGLAYFCGYLILRMASAYYLAPVDLIAILYLGRLVGLSFGQLGFRARLSVAALLLLVVVQDLALSAFRMYERKNVIHAKAEMGQVIRARYQTDTTSVQRLFFPFATPFQVLEFGSYLNYLGVPIEEVPSNTAKKNVVELVDKKIQKDGPCGYRTFACHAGNESSPGDLVIILPDDDTDGAGANAFRAADALILFSYHPRPAVPDGARPVLDCLRVVSPVFALRRLPDDWLHAMIAVAR